MGLNDRLNNAKKQKCDEFYTRIEDIISEIGDHEDYCKHFNGKTVYLNCDSEKSAFWQFFKERFNELGLKKLIATHYEEGGKSYKLEWSGELLKGKYTVNMIKTPLKGDGDFRSDECVEILKSCDIVVTNPPFSLFREWISLLMKYNKNFIVLGNPNAMTYKEVFPLLQNGVISMGYKSMTSAMFFRVTEDKKNEFLETGKVGSNYVVKDGEIMGRVLCVWFTSLSLDKRYEPLKLTATYYDNEQNYPKYDDYDAIECGKVADIPNDYYGVIGVPITYIYKHCPEQFEIVGEANHGKDNPYDLVTPFVNGVQKYKRILIKRK